MGSNLARGRLILVSRLVYVALDRAGYLVTLALLSISEWFAGLHPETPTDRAVREEGERLRREFPAIYFDDPPRP